MNPTCKTCRWWRVLHSIKVTSQGEEPSDDMGRCVRRSPVVSDKTNGKWPTVFADDFCGEHQQMPPDDELCTCHERDSSYVCAFCREQGFKGHMES